MFNALLCTVLSVLAAAEGQPENLALGKPYTLTPTPDYRYCTDAGDTTQLTDGVYTEGHFWTQPTTVGWQAAKPIMIIIDLGAVQPIGGVSLNTAAGVAGVGWPASMDVLVADEPGQYHAVGDLVAIDAVRGVPAPETYAVHRYRADALRTHGRYVAFVISSSPFFFCDEIEVYAGDPASVSEPLPGAVITDLREQFTRALMQTGIRRRIREDALALRKQMQAAGAEASTAKLDSIVKETETASFEVGSDFRAILPLNEMHARVLAVQAERWRSAGLAPLTAWQSGLWEALPFLADPNTAQAPAVNIFAMQGEYRAGVINLSNASEQAMELTLRFDGIPGGAAPDYLRVHEVSWTDSGMGVPVAAALPEAERRDDGWVVRIPSGVTRQVWLTFHPTTLEPGTYTGRIRVEGPAAAEAPLALQVYPLQFPDRPTLHFGGWDYTDTDTQYELTPQNRDALVALLRAYWVDSPWGNAAVLPFGTYDAGGAMTAPPDTSVFDAWVARWPDARQYLVFPAVGDKIAGFAQGTPEFEKAVAAWVTFWANHAKSKNIRPEQIGLLLIDEPSEKEHQATIAAWARVVRGTGTGLRVWEDPTFRDPAQADPEMLALCDALCPNRPIFLSATDEYRNLFVAQRDRGAALEFYSCSGPVRSLDPYTYHRLQAWDCFRYGATATYFWAFADGGGSFSWNEYASGRPSYTPLFIDEASVVTGKHMEACREGLEDYEYLVMLRAAVERAQGAPEALEKAKTLLGEVATRVTDAGRLPSFQWSDPLDRSVADTARKEILEALVALK